MCSSVNSPNKSSKAHSVLDFHLGNCLLAAWEVLELLHFVIKMENVRGFGLVRKAGARDVCSPGPWHIFFSPLMTALERANWAGLDARTPITTKLLTLSDKSKAKADANISGSEKADRDYCEIQRVSCPLCLINSKRPLLQHLNIFAVREDAMSVFESLWVA